MTSITLSPNMRGNFVTCGGVSGVIYGRAKDLSTSYDTSYSHNLKL